MATMHVDRERFHRIPDELVQKAKQSDLISYLKSQGYHLEESDRNNFKVARTPTGATHHSLIVTYDKWHWKAHDLGGNTLDFLIKYEGKSFREAVYALNNMKYTPTKEFNDCVEYAYGGGKEKSELKLPPKNKDFRRVFAYLNKTRCIDAGIISDMMKQGIIYESEDKHNCVFIGKDREGTIRFASLRGSMTGSSFRMNCAGSNKDYCFTMEGKSNKVYVFEAPIDGLSHATITKHQTGDYKKDYRISLDGVDPKPLYYFLQNNPQIEDVVLCLDNDKAGNDACEAIARTLAGKGRYNVSREAPKAKDYNLDLVEMIQSKNMKTEMKI